ncbi:MAG: hypothetical protein R3B68_09520 [Phycisphaerales bacterium]
MVLAAISWDGGGGDALWSNPLNWSLDFVPRQVDDVTINIPNAQRSVVVDSGPVRVNTLTLDETLIVNSGQSLSVLGAFDLTANADLRINGLVNWVEGDWNSDRDARVNPGGTLNIGTTSTPTQGSVDVRTAIDNAGRLAWRGGDINLAAGGSITNRAGKAMDFAAPTALNGPGRFENHGLLRRGGLSNSTTTINAPFETTDRFFILRGTVQVGDDPNGPQAELGGRVVVIDATSTLRVGTRATHAADVKYSGRGAVEFVAAEQTFTGDAFFGAAEASFEGDNNEIPVRITHTSEFRGAFTADAAFFTVLAPLTLAGEFTFIDTILSDTGITREPVLTLAGSVVASSVALAINTVVSPHASLEIGRQNLGPNGLVVSGAYTLTNRGTTAYNLGDFTIGPDGTVVNDANATLILAGPRVGGGPLSGPVENSGLLIRRNSPTNNFETVVTAGLSNTGTLHVQQGSFRINGAIPQLAAVPTAQDTVLSAGTWRVETNSTLDLPQPIERIGANAVLILDGLSNLPDLVGSLRENRGTMRLSGQRPGISGPGPAIVNKGLIEMDGNAFALQVFTTPLDQRASGRIVVRNGTLQVHGVSGNTRDFTNPGSIVIHAGKLTLDLDEGAQQGTFFNTGTLDIRENGQLLVNGAMSTTGTFITECGNPQRGHVFMDRELTIGGTLRANYTGSNYQNFHTSSIVVVASFSVSGSFATFTTSNVPQGFTPLLSTQFGVSIRLER